MWLIAISVIRLPIPSAGWKMIVAAKTEAWVNAQNQTTFDYLKQIPFRDQIRDKLQQAWNYERVGAPFKEGDYTYFYKNDGLQNQFVLYRQKDAGEAEVFLDPNTFSADGTTSMADISFSRDGKLAAYAISEGGSDWRKVIIIDTATKQQIGETFGVRYRTSAGKIPQPLF